MRLGVVALAAAIPAAMIQWLLDRHGLAIIGSAALAAIAAVVAWRLLGIGGATLASGFGIGSFGIAGRGPSRFEIGHFATLPGHAPASDLPLLRALERLMSVERAYRQDSLTISTLATQLDVTARRLRRAIHTELGVGDFEVFLNRYRIAEAKAALADEAQLAVPVLTIGLDAGFPAIGPFIRAFRAETGLTPRAYRRLAMASPLPRTHEEIFGFGQPL